MKTTLEPGTESVMSEQVRINWYRTPVEKAVMSQLMRKSDARGFVQAVGQLLLFGATATVAYIAFLNVHKDNWPWTVPVLLLALFLHGTFSCFLGGIAGHELCHKTPFKTQFWNDFFLAIYGFIAWFDPVAYRLSHVRHHQATVHSDHDGEVVLPQGLDWYCLKFVLTNLTFDPLQPFRLIRGWATVAFGDGSHPLMFSREWTKRILPQTKEELRRDRRNWARIVLLGHLALACIFIATGHWFLVVIFTFGCQYANWLVNLCWIPEHIGLSPNVTDFRLCCRTYTCGRLLSFIHWNMQYHIEHHMFPAVPFYNLPQLRKAVEHDMPPAQHGLWNTWKEILPVMHRQQTDPTFVFVPKLPAVS